LRNRPAVAGIDVSADDHHSPSSRRARRPQAAAKYRASRLFPQIFLQFINHLQRALRVGGFGKWVQVCQAGMRRYFSFRRELYFIVQEPSGYIPGPIDSSM